ncbi:MAG: hypothetical protein WCJ88_03045 [Actinomycetes bacterium]
MSRYSFLGRIAAAALLVVSTAAFASSASAGAATVAPTASPITASMVDNANGTMTLTYTGVSTDARPQQALVLIFLPSGSTCDSDSGTSIASAARPPFLVRSSQENNLPDSPAVIGSGISVSKQIDAYPFRASSPLPPGVYEACLYFSDDSGINQFNSQLAVSLIPPVFVSASMASNPDGTMTLTYANVDNADGRDIDVLLLTGVTSCPTDSGDAYVSPNAKFVVSSNGGEALPASPMLIGPGTSAGVLAPPAPPALGVIAPGSYLACLYYDAGSGSALQQSLAVSLVPAPAPVPEPVTPAFTG